MTRIAKSTVFAPFLGAVDAVVRESTLMVPYSTPRTRPSLAAALRAALNGRKMADRAATAPIREKTRPAPSFGPMLGAFAGFVHAATNVPAPTAGRRR